MSSWSVLDCQRAELEEKLRIETEKESKRFKQYVEQRARKERIEKILALNRARNHAKALEEFDLQTERIEKRIREEGLSDLEKEEEEAVQ